VNSILNPATLNIHGFPKPDEFSSYTEWKSYATNRIMELINSQKNQVDRITIADFLTKNQFKDSRIQTNGTEDIRVKNKVIDPLPPYDFYDATFSGMFDTLSPGNWASDSWYTKANWPKNWPTLTKPSSDLFGAITGELRYAKTGVRRSNEPIYLVDKKQRREWGFRENILQGYPEFEPWFYGSNKIVIGFVTAGSGVFGGIQSNSFLNYDKNEVFRQAELGKGRQPGDEMIPTGLCFIQDESDRAIGISLGSDTRYMYHPKIYKFNFSNPNLYADTMHMGSIMIPKADYRQFLRVGDLIAIEIGTNFKYWHSVLGMQPRYWEELYGPYGDRDPIDWESYYDAPPEDMIPERYLRAAPADDCTAASLRRNRKGLNRPPYINGWGGLKDSAQNHRIVEGLLGIDTSVKWFLHPEDIGRDVAPRGIKGDEYALYPVQEDHPWSTGTPIPVNTGMPYIMSSDFLVDEIDRKAPAPIILKNHELRGIPIFKLEDYKKDIPEINSEIVWKVPENNPWVSRPSPSKYNGMLVQLKNVRFVLPPKKEQFIVKKPLDDEFNKGQENIFTSIKEFSDAYQKYASAFRGVMMILRKPPGDTFSKESSIPFTVQTTAVTQEIQMLNNQIDARGYKFTFDFDSTMRFLRTGDFNGVNLDVVALIVQIGSYAADILAPGAGIGTAITTVFNLIHTTGVNMDWDYEEDGDKGRYLTYEKVFEESPFPKSLDLRDGGYWWTNPNIPLTNARSHFKDFKETTDYDTFGEYIDELELYFGVLGDALVDLKRKSWTQLISSNKLPEVLDRYVKNLGPWYTNSYEPFAEEWKPFRRETYRDPVTRDKKIRYVRNNFQPIPDGYTFLGNRIYYVVDSNNVVIPIRINSNSEIARFRLPIPTGPCDITGIVWQNSLGKPGLEWEREAYNMELWPRFASDIRGLFVKKGPESTEKPDIPELEKDGFEKSPQVSLYKKDGQEIGTIEIVSNKITIASVVSCETVQFELDRMQREYIAGYNGKTPIYKQLDFCDTLIPLGTRGNYVPDDIETQGPNAIEPESVIVYWTYRGKSGKWPEEPDPTGWSRTFRISKRYLSGNECNPKGSYYCVCEKIGNKEDGRRPV